ncbi:MAG: hypothetical protein AABZ00_16630 [Chloroflexota bacterium]
MNGIQAMFGDHLQTQVIVCACGQAKETGMPACKLTVAFEIKILETLSAFIKNLNAKFSPKSDSTTVVFGGDVRRTEGAGLTERLRQQTLKQPLHLPLALGDSPPQRLDPRKGNVPKVCVDKPCRLNKTFGTVLHENASASPSTKLRTSRLSNSPSTPAWTREAQTPRSAPATTRHFDRLSDRPRRHARKLFLQVNVKFIPWWFHFPSHK